VLSTASRTPPAWVMRAASAMSAVIRFAFDHLGAEALFARHHPHNEGSRWLLARLGFRYTHDALFPPTSLQHPSYLLIPRDFRPADGQTPRDARPPVSRTQDSRPPDARTHPETRPPADGTTALDADLEPDVQASLRYLASDAALEHIAPIHGCATPAISSPQGLELTCEPAWRRCCLWACYTVPGRKCAHHRPAIAGAELPMVTPPCRRDGAWLDGLERSTIRYTPTRPGSGGESGSRWWISAGDRRLERAPFPVRPSPLRARVPVASADLLYLVPNFVAHEQLREPLGCPLRLSHEATPSDLVELYQRLGA